MEHHSYQEKGASIVESRFRMVRRARGLSQEDVHRLTGLAQRTISETETGMREPQPRTVRILSEFYDVPSTWLMGLDIPERGSKEKEKQKVS